MKVLLNSFHLNGHILGFHKNLKVACVAIVSVGFGNKGPPLEKWLSPHFSRGQNTENPVTLLHTPTSRKRFLRRLT